LDRAAWDGWCVVYVTASLVVAAVYMTVPEPGVVVQARELLLTLVNIAAQALGVRGPSMHCQFVEIVEVAGKIVKG
jgi:hypothetical protein